MGCSPQSTGACQIAGMADADADNSRMHRQMKAHPRLNNCQDDRTRTGTISWLRGPAHCFWSSRALAMALLVGYFGELAGADLRLPDEPTLQIPAAGGYQLRVLSPTVLE